MDFYSIEDKWAHDFRRVMLAGQVSFDEGEVETFAKKIGYKVLASAHAKSFLSQFPAAVLAVMLSAAHDYEEHTYWPKLAEKLGLGRPLTQGEQKDFGRRFQAALSEFGLQRLNLSSGYLNEILLHATVPAKSQEEFTLRLLKEFLSDPGISGEEIVSKLAVLQNSQVQGAGINVPTLKFLQNAGDFAIYFVEECLGLISAVAAGEDLTRIGFGLPAPVRKSVIACAVRANLRPSERRATRGHRVTPARFALDVSNRTLLLFLPTTPGLIEAEEWLVHWANVSFSTFVHPTLGRAAPTAERVALTHGPGFQALLANKHSGQEISIRLWGANSPFAVFLEDGTWVDPRAKLRQQRVYVLLATKDERGALDLLVDGSKPIDEQILGSLAGWGSSDAGGNFKLVAVNLSQAGRISIERDGKEDGDSVRYISSERDAVVHCSPALGASGMSGEPVTAEFPSIDLPARPSGTSPWKIRFASTTSGQTWHFEVDAADADASFRFPNEAPDGNYQLQIEGRLGSRQTFNFTFISGFSVTYSVPIRTYLPDGSGFEPAVATLHGRNLAAAEIRFNHSEIAREFGIDSTAIILRPPHLSVSVDGPSGIFTAPNLATIHSEDLASTLLRVQTPNYHLKAPKLQVLDSKDSPFLNGISPVAQGNEFSEFKLSHISDALSEKKGVYRAYITSQDQQPILIFRVAPAQILLGCTLAEGDDYMEVHSDTLPAGLQVALYSRIATWREPLILDVKSRFVLVPPEIQRFGGFRAYFQVADNWIATNWERPKGENPNVFSLNSKQPIARETPEEALAYWLHSGETSELLEELPQQVLWKCLTDPSVCSSKVTRDDVEDLCERLLNKDPQAAFQFFPRTIHRRDNYLKLLFKADVVDELPEHAIDDLLTLSIAREAPALFVIAAAGTLLKDENRSTAALELWKANQYQQFEGKLHEDTISLSSWLSHQSPSFRQVSRLDLHSLKPIFTHLGLDMPAPFLSVANIASIAQTLVAKGGKAHDFVSQTIRLQKLEKLFDEVIERLHGLNWLREFAATRPIDLNNAAGFPGYSASILNLPAYSLRLAILCRLAARGNELADLYWHEFKKMHQFISSYFPRLVEFDMVITEIALSNTESKES